MRVGAADIKARRLAAAEAIAKAATSIAVNATHPRTRDERQPSV
jgi:hypothetical protein